MTGPLNDSDDDADLKRAIELSLADAGSRSGDNVIELDSDESTDDEDLKRAIALSLAGEDPDATASESDGGSTKGDQSVASNPVAEHWKESSAKHEEVKGLTRERLSGEVLDANKRSPTMSLAPLDWRLGLTGMNRKQMEEERLARLASKRKAPDSDQESQDRTNRVRIESAPPLWKPTHGVDTSIQNSYHSASSTNSSGSSSKYLRFPKGVVKKTFAYGLPRTDEDIRIEEVFQKDELQMAVLSSFQWDEEWMLSKIDTRKTNICLIAFANSKKQQEDMKANARGSNIKFCFPPTGAMGNMHSKLQLLKFASHLRIVVPTGNLVPYDWGETGVMENMVFIIDLPLIEDPDRRAANALTPFGEELAFFMTSQGLEDSLVKSLVKYDFTATSRYAFVHTIGTTHTGNDWKRTGYCGLGRAVSNLGLAADDVELDYIVSSLGSINHSLITAIYYAAQGDNGLKEYRERSARAKQAKASSTEAALSAINDHFRVYFPSGHTIDQSRGGRQSAGTINTQSKWWDSDTFPRHLVHESQNVRSGLLMHSKLMLVRSKCAGKDLIAWAYVGSANLSESAWGRLTMDKQTGNPKLTCRNWECGVLLSIVNSDGELDRTRLLNTNSRAITHSDTPDDMSVFLGSIPVPIIWPGEAYGRTRAKRPWLFLEN